MMNRSRTKFMVATLVAAALAVLCPGIAAADDAIVYGEDLQPISTTALAFGNVCAGTTSTKDVLFAVLRRPS